MFKLYKQNLGHPKDVLMAEKFGLRITTINQLYETLDFLTLPELWNTDWLDLCKEKWIALKEEVRRVRNTNEIKHISQLIFECVNIILSNQTHILDSLLTRYKDHIKVDRLIITNDNGSKTLITNLEDI